jgi:hypothetical protein
VSPSEREAAERRRAWLQPVAGVVAVMLLGVLCILVWQILDSRRVAEERVATLAEQVSSACATGGDGARELERIGACQQAEEAKTDPAAVQPAQPSDGQVRDAVAAYLQANPPRDGRAPSTAEIDAAVARFCASVGCQGQPGDPGAPGATGRSTGPTADQVRAQVEVYCANNNGCLPSAEELRQAAVDAVAAYCAAAEDGTEPCRGPKGDTGATGPAGPSCPSGYTPESRQLDTDGNPLTPPEDALVCVRSQ